jgi:hypothetical protein
MHVDGDLSKLAIYDGVQQQHDVSDINRSPLEVRTATVAPVAPIAGSRAPPRPSPLRYHQ